MPPTFSAGSASVNIVPDFANAQRAIGRWFAGLRDVQVDVQPNLANGAMARIQAQLAAMPDHEIKIGIDHKHLAREMVKATDFFVGFSLIVDSIAFKAFGPKSVLMTTGIGALTSIAAAASQALPALLLLPAGIAALAAPIAAVALASMNMGEAFKAVASGDAAKMQEALGKLAPAAREFVVEISALKPAFDRMQLAVQQGLFAGLSDSISNLARGVFPILQTQLSGIAEEFGRVGAETANYIASAEGLRDVRVILENIKDSTSNWADAARPMTQIFMDIAAVGVQFLGPLTSGMTDLANRTADWVRSARESGDIYQAIQGGLDALARLGEFVISVGRVIYEVFSAAAGTGGQLIDILTNVMNHLADFLATDPGKSGLTEFFTNIGHAVEALMPGLMSVVEAIVVHVLPAMSGLVAAIAPVVGTILVQLADLLARVAPLFYPAMADAIAAVLGALAPLVPVIATIAEAVLPILAEALTRVAPFITTVAEAFGELALIALEALLPVLPLLMDAFLQILDALMPLLPAILELVKLALPPLVELIRILVPMIVQWVEALVPLVVKFFELIGPLLPVLIPLIVILAGVISALGSPIGIIILALTSLAITLTGLWNSSETFRDIVKGVFTAVADAAVAFWHALQAAFDAVGAAWDATIKAIQWVWDNVLHPIWEAIKVAAQVLLTFLVVVIFGPIYVAWKILSESMVAIWDGILHPLWLAVQAAAEFLWKNVLSPIWDAMKAAWDALLRAFQAAWDTILRPLWEAVQRAAEFLWNNVLAPIWRAMEGGWDVLMKAMRAVYDNVIHPMWDIIQRAVDAVKGAFDKAVDGIAVAWDRIKAVAAVPINFVVKTVLRDGLFQAWNNILDKLGVSSFHVDTNANWLQGVPGYARGGPITDAHDARMGGRVPGSYLGAYADNVLARLNPDEFVIKTQIARRIRPFLEALNAGQAEAVQAAGGWYGTGPGLAGFAAGGNVEGALAHARKMQGTPYIWGGVGPSGADCSGFQSQLVNVMRGRSPYTRLGTTATFPWQGFTTGFGEPYTIGNTKNAFGSGVGHMAGTLAGHSVESGSGHGPMIDGRALNAANSLFGMHAWLSDITGAAAGGNGDAGPTWFESLWGTVTGAKDWLFGQVGKIGELAGKFGDSPFTQWLGEMVRKLPGMMWDKISGTVGSLFSSLASAIFDPSATTNDAAGVKAGVQAIFAPGGWGSGAQWAATDWIIQHESGWNAQAQNSSSTASGLFQFIDGTWRAYGNRQYAHMKDAPVKDQAMAGRRYIAERYGSPVGAQSFWQAHHWYDQGGYLPPGMTTVFNATGRPEPVLTAGEHDALLTWRARGAQAAGAGSGEAQVWHFYLGTREITDLVDIRLEERDTMAHVNGRSTMR